MTMSQTDSNAVRTAVRERYASVATGGEAPIAGAELPAQGQGACCASTCCGGGASSSLKIGYSVEEITQVPDGADMGLGCGNPQAIASLAPGEVVLDLGAGAGFDAFLAAKAVGPAGRVIGVDMTAEMVSRARANAAKAGIGSVEFRLGEIERLPVADQSVDVIMSNCVINLSPDKQAVFDEAHRVLKPGGRLAISDVVAKGPIPDALAKSVVALAGCIAGATPVDEVRSMLTKSGFANVRITVKEASREFIRDWLPGSGAEDYVVSAIIEAVKDA
jgi:ubiquinone/menaquinone biosynthesis C-methylase UbiE